MYANASKIKISIIITGRDINATKVASVLKSELIKKYQPLWNKK